MPKPPMERRRNPRYLCSHLVEISWGIERCHGVLEDLSIEGAGIAAEVALDPGAAVEIIVPGFRPRAGRVRHCLKRETDFFVGIELADQWNPSEWQPDHLLTPSGSD